MKKKMRHLLDSVISKLIECTSLKLMNKAFIYDSYSLIFLSLIVLLLKKNKFTNCKK